MARKSGRPEVVYPSASEVAAARERGQQEMENEPSAYTATYNFGTDTLYLRLTDATGVQVTIPNPRLFLPELKDATAGDLADVRVIANGGALLWDKLDVAIDVLSVAGRIFDLKELRRQMMRQAGSVKSERKAATSRENGRRSQGPAKKTTAAGKKSSVKKNAAKKTAL